MLTPERLREIRERALRHLRETRSFGIAEPAWVADVLALCGAVEEAWAGLRAANTSAARSTAEIAEERDEALARINRGLIDAQYEYVSLPDGSTARRLWRDQCMAAREGRHALVEAIRAQPNAEAIFDLANNVPPIGAAPGAEREGRE